MDKGRCKKTILAVSVIMMTFCLTVSAAPAESSRFNSMSDFIGKKISVLTGTAFDQYIEENKILQGQVEILHQNSDVDSVQSLLDKKCDAIAMDAPVAEMTVATHNELITFPELICKDDFGYGFRKGSPLVEPFNRAMQKLLEEGIAREMKKKWMGTDDSLKVLIPQDWAGEKGTLRYWVNSGSQPMSYLGPEGTATGYAVDLLLHVAREMDYKVEMSGCSFGGLIPAVQSGKADVVGGSLSITQERQESIDFSDPFYKGGAVLVIRKEDVDPGVMSEQYGLTVWEEQEEPEMTIPEKIWDGFYRTFIEESRWKVFGKGLFTTVMISVSSAFFGIILGFALFMILRRSGQAVRKAVSVIMGIIVGIPPVVLLMVLFYVVFAKSSLSAIPVSIVAFTMTFGASVLRMLQTGTGAVDVGQTEGAYALGFSDHETFFRVILPQAVMHIMPNLKAELGALVKATAVVGYIAAHDLTKAGDVVRNRTFEAFFSLVSVAVIYYLLGKLLAYLVTRIEIYIDPARRTKEQILKGVTEHV